MSAFTEAFNERLYSLGWKKRPISWTPEKAFYLEIGITAKKHTSSPTLRVEAGTYFLIKNWKSLSFVQTFRESEKTIPIRIHNLFFTGSDLDNLMVIPEQAYFLYRLEVKGVTGWQNINAYEVFAKLDSGEWKETTSQMDWCRPGAGHFS